MYGPRERHQRVQRRLEEDILGISRGQAVEVEVREEEDGVLDAGHHLWLRVGPTRGDAEGKVPTGEVVGVD